MRRKNFVGIAAIAAASFTGCGDGKGVGTTEELSHPKTRTPPLPDDPRTEIERKNDDIEVSIYKRQGEIANILYKKERRKQEIVKRIMGELGSYYDTLDHIRNGFIDTLPLLKKTLSTLQSKRDKLQPQNNALKKEIADCTRKATILTHKINEYITKIESGEDSNEIRQKLAQISQDFKIIETTLVTLSLQLQESDDEMKQLMNQLDVIQKKYELYMKGDPYLNTWLHIIRREQKRCEEWLQNETTP